MAAAVEDTTTFADDGDDDDDNNNCSVDNNDDDDYNNNNNNKKKNLEYARRLLYISHFTSQFAEWAWQFSLVIWLAALSDYSSLFLVSVYQATAQLLVLSLVPTLSKMIDRITTTTTTTSSSSSTITSTTATATTTTTRRRNKKQQWNRSQFATYLIAAQNVCVFIATMTIGFTMKRHCQLVPPNISNDNDDDDDAISFSRMALIAIICCFGGMAQVLDKTVVVAIERDWIVVMADESKNKTTNKQQQEEDEQQEDEDEESSSTSTSSTWLQDTNVTLKQMDLSCQVLGPSISGLVLANYGNGNGGFGWVGGCTVVSLITEVLCMKQIYQLVPSLQQQQQQQQHQNITNNNNFSQEESSMAPEKKETITAGTNNTVSLQQVERQQQQQRQNASQESSLMALDDDPTHEDMTENNNIQSFSFNNNNNNNTVCWDSRKHHQLQVYASQTMAWAGLGLALLYFNVLTFSGMMTAYLVSCGMSKFTIGIWRGISSIVGLLGTFIFSQSQSRLHLDLETTAFWSLIWEFVWLTLSLSSIWVNNNDNDNDGNNSSSSSSNQNNTTLAATLLIAGVLPSRIGLWVYDISVTQLFQQTVGPNVRGQVGGTQMSLNAFFEFLPFVLGMIYSDVNDFWILIVGGYLSVGLAIVLYTFGVYLPYKNTFQAIPKDDEDFPTADGDVQLTER